MNLDALNRQQIRGRVLVRHGRPAPISDGNKEKNDSDQQKQMRNESHGTCLPFPKTPKLAT